MSNAVSNAVSDAMSDAVSDAVRGVMSDREMSVQSALPGGCLGAQGGRRNEVYMSNELVALPQAMPAAALWQQRTQQHTYGSKRVGVLPALNALAAACQLAGTLRRSMPRQR